MRKIRVFKKVATGLASLLLCTSLVRAVDLRAVKVQVPDPGLARSLVLEGQAKLVADYGGFRLLEVDAAAARALQGSGLGEIREDCGAVELNAGWIRTNAPEAEAKAGPLPAFEGKRLHLVQFAGPVQGPWYESLLATGVQIVAYIPSDAYLVYGDRASLDKVRKLSASREFMQWEGEYKDAYKVDPPVRARLERGNPDGNLYAIQLVKDPAANASTRVLIEKLALSATEQEYEALNYVNLVVRLPGEAIPEIAARPDVVTIQTYREPVPQDERQDVIVAGQISGTLPSGPGYLAWLASKGFTQEQFTASGFGVDVSDDGVDNATTSPTHFGLYVGGVRPGTSRVMYARREGRPGPGTIKGCGGHGNLNAHIVAGYAPDGPPYDTFPFADDLGYRYGTGVCPYVKVGSSVIADWSGGGWFFPDYTKLQADAYQDGARISTNSWLLWDNGRYSAASQTYDALVRDAQPAGSSHPVDGNQEMVIVFAAGNSGPSATTLGDPSTAKNVIAAAASENVRAYGGDDACGRGDSMADSADDIAEFSSRGPCADGRIKPDLAAPGTHITGGVFQVTSPPANGQADPCYTGGSICGGPGGSHFWPLDQQWYSASSGTSHSTPAIAGGAALLRQYFINAGLDPPSPAMTKAYLMNSARYLTGDGANDTLWSTGQGMGLMDLGTAFDGAGRLLRDQVEADLFTAAGQIRTFTSVVGDAALPFRVTLAWTDAPGSTTGAAYCNDLDLTVMVGGKTYKGNVFSGATSVTGGAADRKNNVESVFLPAGVSGEFTVTVTAANINSDGVPNKGGPLDQDFALVVYNVRFPEVLGVSPAVGPVTGGTAVTVTGKCFTGATAVQFGSLAASSFSVLSDTELTAVSPARTAGTVHVTVTTPDGTSTFADADRFTYVIPPPVVTTMAKGKPFKITVSGSNLQDGIQVFIGSDATPWPAVAWTSTASVEIGGGKDLKRKVPKNIPTAFRFVNPDGGEADVTWQWP